jgi:hypothetical protein
MEKTMATTLAKMWNERVENAMEETKTFAKVKEFVAGRFEVEIYPCSKGKSFHQVEMLADMSRAFHASTYLSIDDGKVYASIF